MRAVVLTGRFFTMYAAGPIFGSLTCESPATKVSHQRDKEEEREREQEGGRERRKERWTAKTGTQATVLYHVRLRGVNLGVGHNAVQETSHKVVPPRAVDELHLRSAQVDVIPPGRVHRQECLENVLHARPIEEACGGGGGEGSCE